MTKEENNEFKQDCPGYAYLPTILPPAERIIVIGDIHGDFELVKKSLIIAGVIEITSDNEVKWIGKDTIVVQVGDQVDSCRPLNTTCTDPLAQDNIEEDKGADIDIMKFFTALNKQANKHNGLVISLLGNHEMMNSAGNMSYVSKKNMDIFKDYKARKEAFEPGGKYAKFMACTRLSAVIIGSFLFVHAGIIDGFITKFDIKSRTDLIKINKAVRRWLLKGINKDYVADIINSMNYSPFWSRILGNIPPNVSNNDPRCANNLNSVFEVLKIKGMIIGHTPQFYINQTGINKTCDDRIIRVDIGASRASDKFDPVYVHKKGHEITEFRKAQVLEIINKIHENKEIKTSISIISEKGRTELA